MAALERRVHLRAGVRTAESGRKLLPVRARGEFTQTMPIAGFDRLDLLGSQVRLQRLVRVLAILHPESTVRIQALDDGFDP